MVKVQIEANYVTGLPGQYQICYIEVFKNKYFSELFYQRFGLESIIHYLTKK